VVVQNGGKEEKEKGGRGGLIVLCGYPEHVFVGSKGTEGEEREKKNGFVTPPDLKSTELRKKEVKTSCSAKGKERGEGKGEKSPLLFRPSHFDSRTWKNGERKKKGGKEIANPLKFLKNGRRREKKQAKTLTEPFNKLRKRKRKSKSHSETGRGGGGERANA